MSKVSIIQQRIIAWFDQDGGDLPWRHTRDPYQILVAEVMLQQTQVDRVLPKFKQFIETYANFQALAQAGTADLITLWYPLGYNRRPMRLQAIARQVVADYGGCFPHDFDAMLTLKGVGPYTAGTISCFAFEQDVAVIDTNIRRIIHRWFIGPDIPNIQAPDKILQISATEILPTGNGYIWNSALMDFGSSICTSSKPKCGVCPVSDQCAAFPEILHRKKVRKPAKEKFTTSNRYYRGKVLRLLGRGSRSLDDLGNDLKENYSLELRPWLDVLIAELVNDRLITHDPSTDHASLPE
jgi:A/G-specific adenine glycosylase